MAEDTNKPPNLNAVPLPFIQDAQPVLREEPKQLDKTIPGGRYIVNDQLVNANGEPIKE